MVQGALWPGWVQLTNEHQVSAGDFAAMLNQTGIVPADRTEQFARALYYGFNGDFSTAMQLLAPQMEALVRYHFANAGEPTSTIDSADQTEVTRRWARRLSRRSLRACFGVHRQSVGQCH